jgi:hypothetical protein
VSCFTVNSSQIYILPLYGSALKACFLLPFGEGLAAAALFDFTID